MKRANEVIQTYLISGFVLLLCFNSNFSFSQNIFDARQSVILEATVQLDPPTIVLNWVADTANGGYTIWRKAVSDNTWGDSLATLNPSSTSWTDTNIVIGTGYEYQVLKSLPAFPTGEGTRNTGAGYIYAGIQMPAVHHHGSCLVVIDSTFKNTLAPELMQLMTDLEADGWYAHALYVDKSDSVQTVKSHINVWADNNPDTHQALFLFGRVPVPYSGDIAPDGHHSDHKGAWPSDGYYAVLDGVWTDVTINNTTAASSRNDNRPGDGKFDNSKFPALSVLQVGRVDFSNMDKFPESEEQLLRRYLDKDHAWRRGKMQMEERGIVDNNFSSSVEGLGQAGWRNFAPMFGITNVKDLPYRQTLMNQSYLWSYGCGGGGPESASDISSTTQFTTDSLQTIFTMLFGSYFGDWDYPNDFLRGAIASRTCLASTWGNRPNWLLHHMALGGHLGYAAEVTINNRGLYWPPFYNDYVHSALMGDPTLRMHVHQPVDSLIASQAGLHIQLEWVGVPNSAGYFIYKRTETDSVYQLLNQVPLTVSAYTDACPAEGMISYMVRSMELQQSGSGSYYNLSAGTSTSIINMPMPMDISAQVIMAEPGQSNGSISIDIDGGCGPFTYIWDTGETSSSVQGLAPAEYCVTISDCLGCTTGYCATVEVSSAVDLLPGLISSRLYPNPVSDHLNIDLRFAGHQKLELTIVDAQGRRVDHQQQQGSELHLTWDIQTLSTGSYWLHVQSEDGSMVIPFHKEGK